MRFDVLTIFPDAVRPVLEVGVVGRGVRSGRLQVEVHDLRSFAHDRHRQVDDIPFGGGPGMVLKPEPIFEAVDSIRAENQGPVILMEPWGEPLTQRLAAELAGQSGLLIVCGRYEGVDDRVREGLGAREISIGDYVLSGAEIPALVLVDAVARLVPGVVGDPGSIERDTFSDGGGGYPQFTRPAEYRGMRVPDVLLSGDHKRIESWRRSHVRRAPKQLSETAK